MDGDSDEELMARVARGDEPSFQLLARRYLPRGLGLARRLIGSEAEAEEVVQEALLRVWINAPRWRPLAPFRSWYYRIVVNLCLNRRRQPALAPLEATDELADPRADPCRDVEALQHERLVAAANAALPERQRAAVTLVYQDGRVRDRDIAGPRPKGLAPITLGPARILGWWPSWRSQPEHLRHDLATP
jgi:RNA polymerase sigma-70 factor (ECF subfamily)